MKKEAAVKALHNHFSGLPTKTSRFLLSEIVQEAQKSGLKPPFNVLEIKTAVTEEGIEQIEGLNDPESTETGLIVGQPFYFAPTSTVGGYVSWEGEGDLNAEYQEIVNYEEIQDELQAYYNENPGATTIVGTITSVEDVDPADPLVKQVNFQPSNMPEISVRIRLSEDVVEQSISESGTEQVI